jgi:uroporphyrin-3 C-methyltransferase
MSPRDTRVPLVSGSALLPVRRRPAIFATLLALSALGVGAYLWNNSLDAATALQAEHDKLATLEARLVGMQRQQQHLLDDLTLKSRQLDEVGARVAKWDETLNSDQRRGWLLAEADHYLRLAEQHLLLTRDVVGARTLLEVADRLLAAHGDNRLLPLRQALAHDRLALNAALRVDVPGTYLRLGALSERLAQASMPMLADERAQTRGQVTPAMLVAATSNNASLFDQGWARLRGLVTVRHYEEPVRPLLSDAERALVREALRLDVAQAQLALMRGEPEIYRHSVKTARERFARYYVRLAQPEYQGLLKELDSLAALDVKPAMPDLRASLHALDALADLPPRREAAPAPVSP